MIFFVVLDTPDGINVVITPKDYWDKNHFVIDHDTPETLVAQDKLDKAGYEIIMDSTYIPPEGTTDLDKIRDLMLLLGFVDNPECTKFVKDCNRHGG